MVYRRLLDSRLLDTHLLDTRLLDKLFARQTFARHEHVGRIGDFGAKKGGKGRMVESFNDRMI